ncbi:MAG: 3-hydroxyacyl-ACP dehydratase FabZ [Anaerosomatales bacterium]|nr:3-hydroxyacyl-ACP dehydratase FabZ [Anaerosomatales bacterium]
MLDRDAIMEVIPHRDPFLLVDRVEDMVPGERATGYLTVTADAFWVPGHFPDYPVMPGVLIVEAMAQVGAVSLLSVAENRGKLALFAGIDKVRFKRQVRPGDELRMVVVITKTRGPLGFGHAEATVDGELACSGELMFAIK